MNEEIEIIFKDFTVDKVSIPVAFLFYKVKNGEPYVVYFQYDKDNSYSAEDDVAGYVTYYDFDVYAKGNYLAIVEAIKAKMIANGWTYQPRRESPDMYEADTGYFHKTICFAYPIQEQEIIEEA